MTGPIKGIRQRAREHARAERGEAWLSAAPGSDLHSVHQRPALKVLHRQVVHHLGVLGGEVGIGLVPALDEQVAHAGGHRAVGLGDLEVEGGGGSGVIKLRLVVDAFHEGRGIRGELLLQARLVHGAGLERGTGGARIRLSPDGSCDRTGS